METVMSRIGEAISRGKEAVKESAIQTWENRNAMKNVLIASGAVALTLGLAGVVRAATGAEIGGTMGYNYQVSADAVKALAGVDVVGGAGLMISALVAPFSK